MKIKTFKGKLSQGDIDEIHLQGGEEDKGFRIHKFMIIPFSFTADMNSLLTIQKVKPGSAPVTVDFSDDATIGAAYYTQSDTPHNQPEDLTVMFDKEMVNQNIYLTYSDVLSSTPPDMNYYLELEEVTMSKGEQAVVNFVAALDHGE
jgi:hypothetical protein